MARLCLWLAEVCTDELLWEEGGRGKRALCSGMKGVEPQTVLAIGPKTSKRAPSYSHVFVLLLLGTKGGSSEVLKLSWLPKLPYNFVFFLRSRLAFV